MVALDRNDPTFSGRVGVPDRTAGRLALPVKLYLFAVILPIAFNIGPLYMTTLRLVVLMMVVPLFFGLISGRFGKIFWVDWLFFLHVLWMAVAIGVNNPDQLVQNVGSTAVEFIGGYLIARAFIRDRAQFITLCKWVSTMAVLMVPLALYETMTGRPIVVEFIRSLPGLTSETVVTIAGRMGLERVQAVFAHPIHFGLFCTIAFSLTFVALEGIYTRGARFMLCLGIGLCTFLALSSGALLAMLMQIFLIGWYMTLRGNEKRWWILFWICVVMYVLIDILSTRTPVKVFMSYATFSAHNAYWRGIIFEWGVMNIFGNEENNVPAAPLFGIGLNNWVRPSFMHSGSMDNFWLVLGVRYGVPGFLFLTAGYVITLVTIARRNFSGDTQLLNLRRAWMFTFVGLTFTLVTVHVWTTVYSFIFFIFGAGLWLIETQPQTPDDETSSDDGDGAAGPPPAAAGGHIYSRFPTRSAPSSQERPSP